MDKPLSSRELELLELLAEGLSADESATKVGDISVNTVKTTLVRMYRKLGARNGPHAVHLGHQKGWLKVPSTTPVDPKTILKLLDELQSDIRTSLTGRVDPEMISSLKQGIRLLVLDHFTREAVDGALTTPSPCDNASGDADC